MRLIIFILFFGYFLSAQDIALVKYSGGGDWYTSSTSLKNLINFCNENIKTDINPKYKIIELSSEELFSYPFIHITGHGNIVLNKEEVENLKTYLLSGGFLHIDDNYGLDKYIRKEMKKVFPNKKFIELSRTHPIYNQTYKFSNGLPKIHQHDGKRPQGFGLFEKERLICYYTYESDLGNGWEDKEVHNDNEKIRIKALKMGSNIIEYVFTN